MKVLITGATGLIGKEIVSLCHDNDISVNYLTTSKQKIETTDNYKGFYWNPKKGEIDGACIYGVDAIINLVGASVAKRWTEAHKKEILASRIRSAQLLLKTLMENDHEVKQMISASAIGIYQSSLTNYYEEDSHELNGSYLGNVVSQWENAIDEFEKIGLNVCKIRIGLVLSDKGGALQEIAKPVKFGAGAALGSGNQWQSWIHVEDLAAIFMYILKNKISGVINGVAPNPVTNKEFTRTVARVLNRPLILPNLPRFLMKQILGAMHVILFSSQRVSSKKIEDLGYSFEFHHLEPALEDLLK
jgi:hypothetical protein